MVGKVVNYSSCLLIIMQFLPRNKRCQLFFLPVAKMTNKKKSKATKMKSSQTVKAKMAKLEADRLRKAKSRLLLKEVTNEAAFEASPPLSVKERIEHNKQFERSCESKKHSHCLCCRGVGLNFVVNKKGFCQHCKQKKNKDEYLTGGMLPVWYDGTGKPNYRVPEQLTKLSHAEKILIQRCSPFVALHHIKNGTFGLTGHVCCFEQDIEGFITKLPRLPQDTTVLKVVRALKTEVGGCKETLNKAYRVRKKEVLEALQWLQVHHRDYQEVKIDMSHLDWIEGEEGTLEGIVLERRQDTSSKPHVDHFDVDEREDADDNSGAVEETVNEFEHRFEESEDEHFDRNEDLGPSMTQTLGATPGDNVAQYGYIDQGGRALVSPEDSEINSMLRDSVSNSPNRKEMVFDFPEEKKQPVNEFGSYRIFANAFPWLFPGGIGDVKDFSGKEGKRQPRT